MKNPKSPSEIKPATFRLVIECFNQMRHCAASIIDTQMSTLISGVMILRGKNRTTRGEKSRATFATINPTWKGIGSKGITCMPIHSLTHYFPFLTNQSASFNFKISPAVHMRGPFTIDKLRDLCCYNAGGKGKTSTPSQRPM